MFPPWWALPGSYPYLQRLQCEYQHNGWETRKLKENTSSFYPSLPHAKKRKWLLTTDSSFSPVHYIPFFQFPSIQHIMQEKPGIHFLVNIHSWVYYKKDQYRGDLERYDLYLIKWPSCIYIDNEVHFTHLIFKKMQPSIMQPNPGQPPLSCNGHPKFLWW